jgi:hypothetical protein
VSHLILEPSSACLTFGTEVLHLIKINHHPDLKVFQFIILTFVYSSTCFRRFPTHHQELNDCSGSLWFYLHIVVTVVLCSWLGRPAWPRTQHDNHHDTKVKPETAELLMMGGKRPETCWAVNKRQENKTKNCCIRLIIYLNCTMIHKLTNLKYYIQILAHPVRKMWIIHEPKKVALWNKRHFEEKRRACSMFKILSTYIC